MTTTAQCPVCGNPQAQGLLDDACTTRLEQALGDVRWIVTELDTTLSKQARIGNLSGGGGGGLARERNPISWGAVEAADVLTNVLAFWVVDVCGEDWPFGPKPSAVTFARDLLNNVPDIRKHPAVDELLDQVIDAVEQARRAVDRPADRQYMGQCLTVLPDEDGNDVECFEEVWAREGAHEAVCRVCGVTHEVAERRKSLMDRAKPLIVTVKQASEYMGEVGGITVNAKTIRAWIERGKLTDHSGGQGERTIRLGDLFALLADKSEAKTRTAA